MIERKWIQEWSNRIRNNRKVIIRFLNPYGLVGDDQFSGKVIIERKGVYWKVTIDDLRADLDTRVEYERLFRTIREAAEAVENHRLHFKGNRGMQIDEEP